MCCTPQLQSVHQGHAPRAVIGEHCNKKRHVYFCENHRAGIALTRHAPTKTARITMDCAWSYCSTLTDRPTGSARLYYTTPSPLFYFNQTTITLRLKHGQLPVAKRSYAPCKVSYTKYITIRTSNQQEHCHFSLSV